MNSDIVTETTELPVVESFYTIQGEGQYAGTVAYFIRLAGCDVGCHWCDVKESWDKEAHTLINVDDLVDEVLITPASIVVITGGEPFMHNLDYLTQMLQKQGLKTHVETSGAHPLSGSWNWITLSPKKLKVPLTDICKKAHELKVIVFNNSDFQWAEKYENKVHENCIKYLQPEWSQSKKMLQPIIAYVKKNPVWKISLQQHKFMEIP